MSIKSVNNTPDYYIEKLTHRHSRKELVHIRKKLREFQDHPEQKMITFALRKLKFLDQDSFTEKRRVLSKKTEVYARDLRLPVKIDDGYKRVLGEGNYCTVSEFAVRGTSYAIKIPKNQRGSEDNRSEFLLISHLSHPNLICLYDYMSDSADNYLLLTELADETFRDRLVRLDLLKCSGCQLNVKKNLKQLCKGVQYMHSQNLVHSDLKPKNLLISRHGNLKIADFGGTDKAGKPIRVSSLSYSPPDLVGKKKKYHKLSKELDTYAIGAIFFNVLSLSKDGKVIYYHFPIACSNTICYRERSILIDPKADNLHFVRKRIKRRNNKISGWARKMDPDGDLRVLTAQALSKDPKKRPTAKEMASADYFSQM